MITPLPTDNDLAVMRSVSSFLLAIKGLKGKKMVCPATMEAQAAEGGDPSSLRKDTVDDKPIAKLSIQEIMTKMQDLVKKSQRHSFLLAGLEELYWRCTRPLIPGYINVDHVARLGGMDLAVDVIKLFPDSQQIMKAGFELLLPLSRIDEVLVRFLDRDGHWLIQHLFNLHEGDEFVKTYGKDLIKDIRRRGALLAIDKIKFKIVPEVPSSMTSDTEKPMTDLRQTLRSNMKNIAEYMLDYPHSVRLQEIGCDGFLTLVSQIKTHPTRGSLLLGDYEVVKPISTSLKVACKAYTQMKEIVWKAMRCIQVLAFTDKIRTIFLKEEVLESIFRILRLNQDVDIQQECIWAISELSKSAFCVERIKAGEGWRVLHKLINLSNNRHEALMVVVPIQLKTLFTKEEYQEMEGLSKVEEEEKKRLEKEVASRRKENTVSELLSRNKPRFGTVDDRFKKEEPPSASTPSRRAIATAAGDKDRARVLSLTQGEGGDGRGRIQPLLAPSST